MKRAEPALLVSVQRPQLASIKKHVGEPNSRPSSEENPLHTSDLALDPDTLGGPGHTWIKTSRSPRAVVLDSLKTFEIRTEAYSSQWISFFQNTHL